MTVSLTWDRYCAPVGAAVHIVDGFLIAPDSKLSSTVNPCRKLSDLDEAPCIVLLGEPGLGKSTAIEQEVARGRPQSKSFLIDLRSFGSEMRLEERLSQCLQTTGPATDRLYLFIDGIDECELKPSVLRGLLSDALSTVQIDRVYLRVVCRTAEWPTTLEGVLRKHWPGDSCAFYELLPLTLPDVLTAAERQLADPTAFMNAVHEQHAGYFATKPITLFALLNSFDRTGRLPESTTQLYEENCRILAEELSPSRVDAGKLGSLTAERRLLLAAHIAAYTTFCARHSIWLGPYHEAPAGSFTLRELAGSTVGIAEAAVDAPETAIKEVLETSLFSSRGERLMGLAHKAYEEFLAAWYLRKRSLPARQLEDLLTSSDGAVVPNLLECAAWSASWSADFRQVLMRADPLVLLRSDTATVGAGDRQRLVAELLDGLKAETLTDHDWGIHKFYSRLDHPGLADQLRPILSDHAMPLLPRRFAIDVADACNLTSLSGDIVSIALNANEEHAIRKKAAHALISIADESGCKLLIPLVSLSSAEDPDDEIRGSILRAVWPKVLSTEEMLPHLHPPRRSNLSGSYSAFLHSFPPRIAISDLPRALSWAADLCGRGVHSPSMERLVDDLLVAAAPHTDNDVVRTSVAKIIWMRLNRHASVLHHRHKAAEGLRFFDDEHARRAMVLAVLSAIEPIESNVGYISLARRSDLMRATDLEWLAAEAKATPGSDLRTRLAKLLYWTFHTFAGARDWVEVFDIILTTAEGVPEVHAEFRSEFEPIQLDSELAGTLRRHLEEEREWQRQLQRPLLVPSPFERALTALLEFEGGKLESWPAAYHWIFITPDGQRQDTEIFDAHVQESHGWKSANDSLRARLTAAARKFIERHTPGAKITGGSNIPWPDFVGYGSLVLLGETGELDRRPLDTDVWRRWAPVIYSYPRATGLGSRVHEDLRLTAYMHAPAESLAAVCNLALHEDKAHKRIFTLDRLVKPELWDAATPKALLTLVQDNELAPESCAAVLEVLIESGFSEAIQFALSLVPIPPPPDSSDRTLATAVAAALLFHSSDHSWQHVWKALEADSEFGKDVLKQVAHGVGYRLSSKSLAISLTEERAAQLYVWMERQFPRADDPDEDGWHSVGARESVGELRDSLLRGLVHRGTQAALVSIATIHEECPHLPWLKWQLVEARKVTRTKSWEPLTPIEFQSLLEVAERRVIANTDDLLDLVCACLARLQDRLTRDASYCRDYWERQKSSGGQFMPVTEGRFRDLVARHLVDTLQERQLIVNREVEIIPHPTGNLGQRTDIIVDALRSTAEGVQRLTVVVECKGCWNADLAKSLEAQLVDRYLKKTAYTHGIYLVASFVSSEWYAGDGRRKKCADLSRTLSMLRAEAAALSRDAYQVRVVVLENAL